MNSATLMSKYPSDGLTFKNAFRGASGPEKAVLGLSCWFGTGLAPGAPGTFGTLGAIPLAFILKYLGDFYGALFLAAFTLIAIWVSDKSKKLLGRDDPSEVVIDEVTGFIWAIYLVPFSVYSLILGFFLFRFFDIVKPFPIRRIEKLSGGWGIVLDDVVAGIYSNPGIRIFLWIFSALQGLLK